MGESNGMGLGLGVGEMECKQWEGESISAGSGHQLSLPPQHPYTHPPAGVTVGEGGAVITGQCWRW